MANVLDRNFDFVTNGTVTAAGLHNLIDETNIYAGLISTQEAKTTVGTGDLLLIADSSSIGSPQVAANRVTVQKLFSDTLTNGTFSGATITNGTIPTLTSGTTTGTAGIFTSGTITTGVIPTGTFGTTTSTAATITTGTIPNLTTGTTTSTNAVVTNGTITNLSATTSTFLGTITGSTNVINIGSGQIYKDASGNVGVGTTSPSLKLTVASEDTLGGILVTGANAPAIRLNDTTDGTSYSAVFAQNGGVLGISADVLNTAANSSIRFEVDQAERLRIESAGQIGIGGANYGSSGQVLTSGGASAAPSWTTITSTPADGSITFAKLSASATEADNVAKRVAKVWVNYNGTTAGIRDDFNVSSITDNAEGDQTVNFSSSLSSGSYCAVTTVQGPLEDLYSSMLTSVSAPATGSVRVRTGLRGVAFADCTTVNVCIFL
jgi:hypothetical protein